MDIFQQYAKVLHQRLTSDRPAIGEAERSSIVRWITGPQHHFPLTTTAAGVKFIQTANYRYRILRRYWNQNNSEQAYGLLLNRLGALIAQGESVRAWLEQKPEHRRFLSQGLAAMIQQLAQCQGRLQVSNDWIAQCSSDPIWREVYFLAEVEMHCLQAIGEQPRLIFYFIQTLCQAKAWNQGQAVKCQDLLQMILEDTRIALADLLYQQSLIRECSHSNPQRQKPETTPIHDPPPTSQLLRSELQQVMESDLQFTQQKLAELGLQFYLLEQHQTLSA